MCNHHHTPVKINGRSMFYSWLLEMVLFLRVEPGERERERRGHEREEGGEVGRGAEKRDCPMLVGMVTRPGERDPGRGGPLSHGSSLSAASLSPTIPCRLKRIITALWVAVEEQDSPHLHMKDTLYCALSASYSVFQTL